MAQVTNKTSRIINAAARSTFARHKNTALIKMAEATATSKSSPAQEFDEHNHLGARPGVIRNNLCSRETLSIAVIP
jgi:hypothetical protein